MNLSILTDEQLLQEWEKASPILENATQWPIPVLREFKLRFQKSRKNKKPYRGYTSFNKFCEEKLNIAHQTVRRLIPDIKLQKHPSNKTWQHSVFGEDAAIRHEEIGKRLLDIILKKIPCWGQPPHYRWGGWAPWKPYSDTDKKDYAPIEDRYRFTLFLSAKEIEDLFS